MQNLIDKFQAVHSEIRKEKGDFYLFMVFKMDEFADKWSVAISAPWATREKQKESFQEVARKITRSFSTEEVSSIARIGIFQPDEHLVRLITGAVRVQDGSKIKIEDQKINGFEIHEGYIFESVAPQ